MGAKKTPKQPSPQAQASAQTAASKEAAAFNAQLQNMNQYTPYGNQTFTNSGTKDNPKWSSTTTLSPEQQRLLNSSQSNDIALSNLGGQQIGRIANTVATPFSFGGLKNQVGEGDVMAQQMRAEEALMSRLNPQFSRDEEALRTRLINQGIGQGTQAYNREMENFNQSRNDARTQAILAGQQYGGTAQDQALQRRSQEINEYQTQRNAPLNEYIGMTSGTQVQNPSFQAGMGNSGIQAFDMAGAMQNAYSNKQAAANNQNSAIMGLIGTGAGFALGGPVGAAAGGSIMGGSGGSSFNPSAFANGLPWSDMRLKEDIKEIGATYEGTPIYTYKLKGSDVTHMGVMAQEVMQKNPDAVVLHDSGYYKVDYSKVS
jgi:hypothetical protein